MLASLSDIPNKYSIINNNRNYDKELSNHLYEPIPFSSIMFFDKTYNENENNNNNNSSGDIDYKNNNQPNNGDVNSTTNNNSLSTVLSVDCKKNKKMATTNTNNKTATTPLNTTTHNNNNNNNNKSSSNTIKYNTKIPKPRNEQVTIEELREYDVLCGRSKIAFNNIGNRRFRITILLFLSRYLESPCRNDRSALIYEIIDTVHESGGRFLKQQDNNESLWVEVSQRERRNKVGHALRDAASGATTASSVSKKFKKGGGGGGGTATTTTTEHTTTEYTTTRKNTTTHT